jgi:DNA-binding NtrC family response regulator
MPKQHQLPVIVVDDEEEILFSASYLMNSHGINPVVTFADGRELLPFLEQDEAGVVVLDLSMPQISGIDLLGQLTQRHPDTPVVVMTASQEVETAVSCMKEGAFDYLVKPVEESRFISSVRRALEVRSLRRQVGSLRHSLMGNGIEHPEAFDHIITANRRMHSVFQYVEAVAESSEPVLITGETGTGK